MACLESMRMLLALAVNAGWAVHHMDIRSVFPNGELEEEVYMQQPPGFKVANKENLVLCLNKAMYGLKQAPRA